MNTEIDLSNGLRVNAEVAGVVVDVNFIDKVCDLTSDSGDGKTYLFSLLSKLLVINNIDFAHLDYNDSTKSEDVLFNYCKSARVVILDNADLYLTRDLAHKLARLDCIILFVSRTVVGNCLGNSRMYWIEFDGNKLVSRRF